MEESELARADELLTAYLTWMKVERGRSPNTVSSYRRDLLAYAEWRSNCNVGLFSVTSTSLESYVDSLRQRYAASSVARQLTAVRMFHRFLVEYGARVDNPCDLLEGVRVPVGIPKPLDEDEVLAVLSSVNGDSPASLRDRALLEMLYATGARISEACGLNLDDLDMSNAVVRLFGKGAKERVVPIGSEALRRMAEYLDVESRGVLAPPTWRSSSDREAVFLSTRGRRLTRQKAWSIVRDAGRRAGIQRELSPHVLRHSCATHMLEHGADLRVVQEMLGHVTISTTQVYTRVSHGHLLNVYRSTHPRERLAK